VTDGNGTIVFLCFGNICRSPFAERYWNGLLDRSQQVGPRAVSAGFHETSNRETPKAFVELAAEFGVDLESHRSQVVSRELLTNAEAILMMDKRNQQALADNFPGLIERATFLGSYAPQTPDEIADPWGKAPEVARDCYRDLARAVDGLWEHLCR
jgi:protein-tyrosine-phosphatase